MFKFMKFLSAYPLAIILAFNTLNAQYSYESLIVNTENRNTISLDGKWDIIVDPYENGYYNHQYKMRANGYFKNQNPKKLVI